MNELAGRVAVVTGAARNIGRSIAQDLARGGARVVVNALNSAAAAEETVQLIRDAGGEAIVHIADVTDEAATQGLAAAAVEAFGGLDILVNNAAIRRETPFAALTPVDWREVMGVILDGAYLCTRAALPHLQRSSMASIVNIGGLSGHTGSPGRAHVVAAKAGLAGLTRALAHDFGPDGITVNCVVPGLIDTVRGASATGGTPAMHGLHRPLAGRRGRPEEVAALVRFLCGPQARYLTGQTMHANGGAYLG
jgi:3-oxoacyl-[acyl-carrier protein] reductase